MSKKKNNIKLDNVGGVIYTAMRQSRIRHAKFKPAFVASLPRLNNYSRTAACLLEQYKETGSLKCSCCDSSEAYFEFHVENGRATFRAMVDVKGKPMALTVDHDMLKCLGGEDAAKNYNPLCYQCNQIRGSRFAGFKEFKEWYDKTKEESCIDTFKLPTANFCHIDFMQNLNNLPHTETIHNATALPPSVINMLKKEMRLDQYDLFSKLSIKVWVKMDRDFANSLLNELVLERIHKRHNKRFVPMQNHNYFGYSKNIFDHRKIKAHIEEQMKVQIRQLRNLQAPVAVEPVQKDVKEINSNFFKNVWVAVRNIFA